MYDNRCLSYLLNEVNSGLEIKAKVNELPVNAFTSVLVLLQDEHRVVEQLLKLFICIVDAQLLERIELQTTSTYNQLTQLRLQPATWGLVFTWFLAQPQPLLIKPPRSHAEHTVELVKSSTHASISVCVYVYLTVPM